jgi:AcrR family transcriptional regulator
MSTMNKMVSDSVRGEGKVRNSKPRPRALSNRRERRKLATRQALLDATQALLAKRSFDSLSVDDIVERADVARGTFYNYFVDKDALERELASQSRARVEAEIARVNEGIIDPPERIARAFLSVLQLGISTPQQATAMMKLFPRATDPAAPSNAGVRRDAVQGMTRGRIVATSEDAVVACVMGVFTAGVNRSLDLPAGRVREFAQGLGTILLHGLGLKRAEAERIMRDAIEAILPRA